MPEAYISAVAVGIALAGCWIWGGRRYPGHEISLFAYTLVLAGVIYVFFGLLDSRPIGSMLPEALAGLLFIGLAMIGLRGSLLALGIGWIMHGVWDVVSPHAVDVSYLPWFLEPTCVGYDFIVGTYLVLRSVGIIRKATERAQSEGATQ